MRPKMGPEFMHYAWSWCWAFCHRSFSAYQTVLLQIKRVT